MAKHTSPIPPTGRSPKGPPKQDSEDAKKAHVSETDKRTRNLEQQGHQANITQNTRNQGYQQDR